MRLERGLGVEPFLAVFYFDGDLGVVPFGSTFYVFFVFRDEGVAASRLNNYSAAAKNASPVLERPGLEKSRKGRPRQSVGTSFPLSTKTRQDPSF